MLDILAILNLIVAVQAIFLGIHFLIKKKGEQILNFLVALLNLTFALITFNTYLNLNGHYNQLFQDVANNVMWFIGPALYLFIGYNEYPVTKKRVIIHTLPYLVLGFIGIGLEGSRWYDFVPVVGLGQMCLYLFFAISHGIKYYNKAKPFFNWILPVVISFSILVVVNFSLNLLEKVGIGILSDAALQSFTSVLVIPIFLIAYKEMNSTQDFGFLQGKYKTSPISKTKSQEYLQRIEKAFAVDKLYLNPNLTLSKVAQHLSLQPKYISQVINQELQQSFSDYLLRYRIEQVKKDLIDPNKANLTINGVAQDAGFASSSRFNHLFKKNVGITPGQYKKMHQS